jgi:hypothetical protein
MPPKKTQQRFERRKKSLEEYQKEQHQLLTIPASKIPSPDITVRFSLYIPLKAVLNVRVVV